MDSRAAPQAVATSCLRGAAGVSGPPDPAAVPGHFVVGPSVATEAAALEEDDLAAPWWLLKTHPGAPIRRAVRARQPHRQRRGRTPRGGAALESAPAPGAISQNPVDASAGRDCASQRARLRGAGRVQGAALAASGLGSQRSTSVEFGGASAIVRSPPMFSFRGIMGRMLDTHAVARSLT